MPSIRSATGAFTGPTNSVISASGRAGAHDGAERFERDLQIEPEGPVLDVPVVPLDPIGERGLSPEAVDLRPTRDARLHAMAIVVAIDVLAEHVDELRPFRAGTDQAH